MWAEIIWISVLPYGNGAPTKHRRCKRGGIVMQEKHNQILRRDFGGVTMDKKTKRLLKELALIALVAIILYFVAFVWFIFFFRNATVIWG